MKIAYQDSNRIGKINILYETIREDRELVGALMALLLPVLHVEDHESGRGKTYYAASELFQPIVEDEEIPQYRIEFVHDQPFEDAEREVARVNSGKYGFVAIRNTIVRVPPLHIGGRAHQPHPLH
jgi:hypothetical protein